MKYQQAAYAYYKYNINNYPFNSAVNSVLMLSFVFDVSADSYIIINTFSKKPNKETSRRTRFSGYKHTLQSMYNIV